jgi:hypothetical protein
LVAERAKDWELYDLSRDRCETEDLAAKHPERVQQLSTLYNAWAERTGGRTHAQSQAMQPSDQSQLIDLEKILGESTE